MLIYIFQRNQFQGVAYNQTPTVANLKKILQSIRFQEENYEKIDHRPPI